MQVQLPNENDFIEMDIDPSRFKLDKQIGDVRFGWYEGTYIGIKENHG